jgi:DNA repair photolyase
MKRWGNQKPVRFDHKEYKEFERDIKKYGEGKTIFVGSSCDMFAPDILRIQIVKILNFLNGFSNRYLYQTKNPARFRDFSMYKKFRDVLVTTIETNRWYQDVMNNSPHPIHRAEAMKEINLQKYVTIEPIMDFDLDKLAELIKMCSPLQVNIGADSGNNNLPEPSKDKILSLISELEKFTVVEQKKNLKRLLI